MQWRSLCLVRAVSAAGLISGAILGAAAPGRADDGAVAPAGGAVKILDARAAGDLEVVARGQGENRVKLALRNVSGRRLQVVLPPGLVAANATGQGFQSMGLGTPTDRAGAFGAFRGGDSGAEAGFRSVGLSDPVEDAVAVPAGQTVELTLPAVCLNFGMPTPTAKDTFELVDVDDFSTDARVRKALRSLAVLGTSIGTAQAAMWRVCNGLPFEAMAARGGKVLNAHEVALAARFVEALDASTATDLVDPAYLTEGRIFVTVAGEGTLAKDAARLQEEVDGLRLFGLPARAVAADETPTASGPAMHLGVVLAGSADGRTQARLVVRSANAAGRWSVLGDAAFAVNSAPEVLDADGLARAAERAVAGAFVKAKPIRKSIHQTVIRIENRLPFTLASVYVQAGDSAGAPVVELDGMGIGPARSGLAPIQAASAKVERVVFNGL